MVAKKFSGTPSADYAAVIEAKASKGVVTMVLWTIDGVPVHAEFHDDPDDAVDAARAIFNGPEWGALTNGGGHYQTLTGHPFVRGGGIQREDVILFKRAGEVNVRWVGVQKDDDEKAAPKTKAKPKPQAAKTQAAKPKPQSRKTVTAKRSTTTAKSKPKPKTTARKTTAQKRTTAKRPTRR